MSIRLANSLRLKIDIMRPPLIVITPMDGRVTIQTICQNCTIDIAGYNHEFNFILLKMVEFDLIIGMDWLSQFKAKVNCYKKSITFQKPNDEILKFVGKRQTLTASSS